MKDAAARVLLLGCVLVSCKDKDRLVAVFGDAGSKIDARGGEKGPFVSDSGVTNDAGVTSDSGVTNDAGVTSDSEITSDAQVAERAPDGGSGDHESNDGSCEGNATQLAQYDITWSFDTPSCYGRFANGDHWVLGPVSIVQIDPPSIEVEGRRSWADVHYNLPTGSSYINGSMINPIGGVQRLGYDSATYATGYDHSKNAAFGVSSSAPLVLQPGTSLISSISRPEPQERPQLLRHAVLTVLDRAPPPGSFRPSYAGSDKTIRYNASQLDYSRLHKLAPVGNAPSLANLENRIAPPCIDHQQSWSGPYSHAQLNCPEYRRDVSSLWGDVALLLHLDHPDTAKTKLLINFVQHGIDLHGVLKNGPDNQWGSSEGNNHGRKWPILFAGIMLGDPEIKNAGINAARTTYGPVLFSEDSQTFHVAETSPGVYNYGHGGYTSMHVGLADWSHGHSDDPAQDDHRWQGTTALAYRFCCNANSWSGFALSARLMDAVDLWNHKAFFDHQDRYMAVAKERYGVGSFNRSSSAFAESMWDTYRSGLGPNWYDDHCGSSLSLAVCRGD